jgi:hypothetical protein
MTTTNTQRIFLDDICRRWHKNADQILELAITGKVALWIAFSGVFVDKAGKAGGGTMKRKAVPRLHDQVEVSPRPEVLTQVQGRCDRILVAAEFPCLDDRGKEVVVSNSVGEEWGETSMLGLKPADLFVRLSEVLAYERRHGIQPAIPAAEEAGRGEPSCSTTVGNAPDHPCFAPELQIALQCWQALFAPQDRAIAAMDRADIVAWLEKHAPQLSKTARERIVLVVSPGKTPNRTRHTTA